MKKSDLTSIITQVVLSFIFMSITTWANIIINVPADEPAIQAGIDAAVPGDTVLVAPGRYYENIDFHGKGIVVASLYIQDEDTSFISSTIIDGSAPSRPDSASCVMFVSGEDRMAALIGFTLTGGSGTLWPDVHSGNTVFREGGGIIIEFSSPTILHNRIINNDVLNTDDAVSTGGGGIRCSDGDPLIENNLILSNQGRYGAGVVLYHATGILRNNVIAQNIGGDDFGGGGIWKVGEGITILENNTIADNHSVRWGGGINAGEDGLIIGSNNILWGNTTDLMGPQIYMDDWLVDLSCSDIEGDWYGSDNIHINPIFCDPLSGNYYIDSLSPCLPENLFNYCGVLIGALEPSCRNCDDNDNDGYCAILDNCPYDNNPEQEDIDNDGTGDVCDNCVGIKNGDQVDSDDDSIGDLCDNCPNNYDPTQYDEDGDGVGSVCDNCPNNSNPFQEDDDGDGIGNICDYLCGDTDWNREVDITDVVYLINYLYKGWPPPYPYGRGDVNADDLVNILDIVYLLNYKYKGGPVPDCN